MGLIDMLIAWSSGTVSQCSGSQENFMSGCQIGGSAFDSNAQLWEYGVAGSLIKVGWLSSPLVVQRSSDIRKELGVDLLLHLVNSGQLRWFRNHIRTPHVGGRVGKCSPGEIPPSFNSKSVILFCLTCINNSNSLFIVIFFSFR